MQVSFSGAVFAGKASILATATAAFLGTATAALALVPGGGGGPDSEPNPPKVGPGLPYISGRLAAPASAAVTPPAGAVVPDEFCIPGKLNDCGEHLRDQQAPAPFEEPETVFFGDPNLAFSEARNSGWVDGQLRTTDLLAVGETRRINTYSVGVDHRFGDKFLLGVMAANTTNKTTFAPISTEDLGTGMLAGPYFALQLSENWAVDGKYVLGKIAHTITTSGTFSGEFQSDETFAALRVSGLIERENWRFHPSLEYATMTRKDPAYIDGVRGPVPAATNTESFATAAMLAYYKGLGNGDGGLMPYAGLEVSQRIGAAQPFATLRVGMSNVFGNGAMLNLDYAYGAIGLANVDDRLITVRFEIPF